MKIDTTKKRYLNGREVIFMKHEKASQYNQCEHCAYYENAEDCPHENADLTCDEDLQSVWQYKQDVDLKPKTLEELLYATPTVLLEAPVGRKYDSDKPMYALLPVDALEEVTQVLTAGAKKYNEPLSEENWRKVDNPYFRYFSAAQRHMAADRKGELLDIDKVNKDGSISKGTDCYHLACAIASLMFMLQLRMEENNQKGNL